MGFSCDLLNPDLPAVQISHLTQTRGRKGRSCSPLCQPCSTLLASAKTCAGLWGDPSRGEQQAEPRPSQRTWRGTGKAELIWPAGRWAGEDAHPPRPNCKDHTQMPARDWVRKLLVSREQKWCPRHSETQPSRHVTPPTTPSVHSHDSFITPQGPQVPLGLLRASEGKPSTRTRPTILQHLPFGTCSQGLQCEKRCAFKLMN